MLLESEMFALTSNLILGCFTKDTASYYHLISDPSIGHLLQQTIPNVAVQLLSSQHFQITTASNFTINLFEIVLKNRVSKIDKTPVDPTNNIKEKGTEDQIDEKDKACMYPG